MDGMVPVRARDCACPGRPHKAEGDIVYLKPMLGLDGGIAAEMDLVMVADVPESRRVQALFARWAVTFVAYGAVGWNLVRKAHLGETEAVPFDVEVVLADYALAKPVADKAGDLYREEVTNPLVAMATGDTETSSPSTPINGSTSPTPRKSRKASGSSSQPASDGEPSLISQ